MSKIFFLLLKWVPVGVGGYLLVVFLFSNQWIQAVITTVVTLVWMGWNPNRFINNLPYNNQDYLAPEKKFNWDSIKVFDPANSEHQYQGELIINLCNDIILWFGSENKTNQESNYQDEFVKIVLQTHISEPYSSETYREKVQALRVFVVSIEEAVLEADKYVDSNTYYYGSWQLPFTINVFRPGSWINHVTAFKSEINQLQDEANKKEEQARLLKEELERQKRFGRID